MVNGCLYMEDKEMLVPFHSIAQAHKASNCRKLRSEPRFTPKPILFPLQHTLQAIVSVITNGSKTQDNLLNLSKPCIFK